MMKRIHVIAMLAVVLLAASGAQAQTMRMEKAVVSNGGGRSTSASSGLDYTIGQQIAGIAQSATTMGQFGFWNIANVALSVDPEAGAGAIAALTVSPNPVADHSVIEIALLQSGRVDVTLYDATGKSARTLFSGIRPAGRFVLPLDAAGLASGAYFIAVSTPGALLGRSVTVVR